MTTIKLQRPALHESNDYFKRYINKVATNDIIAALSEGQKAMEHFCQYIPADKWDYRYAEGKWTIKEILLHIIDTERIMAYRALRIARNDKTALPEFEQDDFILYCNANERSPESLLAEYMAVRASTISLFLHFDDEMWGRMGTASNYPISARALAYIIAGHEIHHLAIVKERYLV
ncbi:MAG: DinB family protein [Chitinophagales bacterium]